MAYLVTGGAGFIGSGVSERLLARGESVIALGKFTG
jgi:nucleoside-diphosphate-sugar epimerase